MYLSSTFKTTPKFGVVFLYAKKKAYHQNDGMPFKANQ